MENEIFRLCVLHTDALWNMCTLWNSFVEPSSMFTVSGAEHFFRWQEHLHPPVRSLHVFEGLSVATTVSNRCLEPLLCDWQLPGPAPPSLGQHYLIPPLLSFFRFCCRNFVLWLMVSEVRHWLVGRGSHSAGQNGSESSPKLEKEWPPANRMQVGRWSRLWVSRRQAETGFSSMFVSGSYFCIWSPSFIS